MKKVCLAVLLLGVMTFVGCGGSSSNGGGGGGGTTPTLVSITVTPANPSIAPGATQQFTATGNYSDGTTKNLTSSANWLVTNTAIATINVSGLATAVAPGNTTVTASSGSISGSTQLSVTNPLVSIAVTPANPTISFGGTQQFTATGTYADGSHADLTPSVTWTSSNTTGVPITAAGLASGTTGGATSTIKATSGSIFGTTSATVSNPIVTIAITPTSVTLAPNATQQYTATATLANGSKQNITTTATWNATAGATITSGGLATAVTPGATVTVTATQGSVSSNNATLTVTNPLVSIAVTPNTVSVAPNATQQFTATGTYADNSTQVITTTATWTATAGATIGLHTGLATAVTPNAVVTITATVGSVSGTATLTVTNPLKTITVTPNPVTVSPVPPNNTQQFTATGTYADNSTQNITNSVTWSASVGGTITQTGLATAVTPNATVTIMATQGSISGTAIMNVSNPLVKIDVTPAAISIAAGTTQQFVATGTYADNTTQVLTSTVTWASNNTAVATISNSQGTQGLATGVSSSVTPVQITASQSGVTSTPALLTVTSATLNSIAVTPNNAQIVIQTKQQYTAIGTFSDSSTQDISNTVTWTSSDTSKVTITQTGLANGVATTNTPVNITASKNSITSPAVTATVIPATVSFITVTPTTPDIALGTSRQYTAIATLTNSTTLNVTFLSNTTWNSSNPAAATIGLHSGVLQTVQAGSTDITATYNGVTSTPINVTVKNLTVQSITVTSPNPAMPVGVTQKLTATALFSDGSTQDVSPNATWNSSVSSVASVSNVGVVSSVGGSVGSTDISATFLGQTGTLTMPVDNSTLTSINVVPGSAVLPVGNNINFNAFGKYSDTYTFLLTNLATWNSSNTGAVTIGSNGVAATIFPGTSNITAAYQSVTSPNATVVVNSFPLTSIAVTPTTVTVPVGVTAQFQAVGTFADNSTQNLTTYATWAATPASVASISNNAANAGTAIGVGLGTADVTALFAGVVNQPPYQQLTVNNATIKSIAILPANPSVNVGAQVGLAAKGTFTDGNTYDITNQVTWASSDPTIATVSSSGLCSGVKQGSVSITANFNGQAGTSTTLTVN